MIIVEVVVETPMMQKVSSNVLRGQKTEDRFLRGKILRLKGKIQDILNLHGLLHNLLALPQQQGIQSLQGVIKRSDCTYNKARGEFKILILGFIQNVQILITKHEGGKY